MNTLIRTPPEALSVEGTFSILFIPPLKVQTPGHYWSVRHIGSPPLQSTYECGHVTVEDGCTSVHEPITQGGIHFHQIHARGRLSFDEMGVCIKDHTAVRHTISIYASTIRIRFNTEYIKDPTVHPWRILVDRGNGFIERQVDSFDLEGYCYTTSEFLPTIGEKKWHIGCVGHIAFKENHAHIISQE